MWKQRTACINTNRTRAKVNVGYKEHFETKNKNEPKTGLLAFSKDNSIQYHFIEVMRCIFLVFKLKNSSQKLLKDKLQILHLNFKFKVTFQKHCTKNICLFVKF